MDGIGRLWLLAAGISGAVAVAAGAYANHALAVPGMEQAQSWMRMAGEYQLWHALALIGAALLAGQADGAARFALRASGWLFLLGSLLFCGTLHALALGLVLPLGNTAPAGGTALIAAWLSAGAAAVLPGWRWRGR